MSWTWRRIDIHNGMKSAGSKKSKNVSKFRCLFDDMNVEGIGRTINRGLMNINYRGSFVNFNKDKVDEQVWLYFSKRRKK